MPATKFLILANIVVFIVYLFQSSFTGISTFDGPVLIKMGAIFGPNVLFLHEYWRLFTSLFLHANVQHIGLNMFSLFIFGRMLEAPLGSARLLVLYLSAGLLGGLCSVAMHPLDESVGASGAIFGLVGFYFSLQLQLDKKAHPALSYRIRQLIGMGIALYCISLTPGVDNAAHLGGLVGGVICGGLFQRLSDVKVAWGWRDVAITLAMAVLFTAGLWAEATILGESQSLPSALLLKESVEALHKNDLKQAVLKLDQALKVEPKNVRALLLRSSINLAMSRYSEALVDTNKALEIEPNSASAYNQRASVYLAFERYKDALADAKQALDRNPHLTNALDTEAMALAYGGQLQPALTEIKKAIEEESGNCGICYYHRAKIYVAMGDRVKAAEDMEQARKLGFAPEQWENERPVPGAINK